MLEAVRRARAAGVRTGLVSNSWGTRRYPRDVLTELFDGVVISGEVGIRKPAPEIYALGAQSIGLEPETCVFVDDLPFNLAPAAELGMATVLHRTAEEHDQRARAAARRELAMKIGIAAAGLLALALAGCEVAADAGPPPGTGEPGVHTDPRSHRADRIAARSGADSGLLAPRHRGAPSRTGRSAQTARAERTGRRVCGRAPVALPGADDSVRNGSRPRPGSRSADDDQDASA